MFIIGEKFGQDPGPGNRATDSYNITINDRIVRDERVLSWEETKITVGLNGVGDIHEGIVTVTKNGRKSNGYPIPPKMCIPDPPSDLTGELSGCSQIILYWKDNSENENGFTIEKREVGGGEFVLLDTVGADITTYSYSEQAGRAYVFHIFARGTIKDSGLSNETYVTTLSPSSAPSGLSVTVSSSRRLDLQWQDNSMDEKGFTLERKTGESGSYEVVGTTGINVTSYADTNLVPSTVFYYRISAFNECGPSGPSLEVSATTFSWKVEAVDAPHMFGSWEPSHAIGVDSSGNIHIAYGGDHLYHAYSDGVSWTIETVDSSSGVGNYPSLMIDTAGKLHISYQGQNCSLTYATNTNGFWEITVVDSNNFSGLYTSIDVDYLGKVHISYKDMYGTLKYATNASGMWNITALESGGVSYNLAHTSIGVDKDGKVHIVYTDLVRDQMKYMTNVSGMWNSVVLYENADWFAHPSLAIDSQGKTHISYYDSSEGDLKYIANSSGEWITTVVDSSGSPGRYSSIFADAQDRVHISYIAGGYGNEELRYASNSTGAWITAVVGKSDIETSLAVGSDGTTHIASLKWWIEDEFSLMYSTNGSGTWLMGIVDIAGNAGISPSIDLDGNGKPSISYTAYLDKQLHYSGIKYASMSSGKWNVFPLVSRGDSSSLQIDSNNNIHIVYDDYAGYDIKVQHMTYTLGEWVTETIASSGYESIMVLDAFDHLHIIFEDTDVHSINYANNSSGSWTISTINQIAPAARRDLAVDSNGYAHISYLMFRSSYDYAVVYASNVLGNWVTTVVDTNASAWDGSSIGVDSLGKVHISYISSTGELKYASNKSGAWETIVVDAWDSDTPSLAVDTAGFAHICYRMGTDIKYASNITGSWTTSIVELSISQSGPYTSIIVDADGNPHMSYYDSVNRDLKYATTADY